MSWKRRNEHFPGDVAGVQSHVSQLLRHLVMTNERQVLRVLTNERRVLPDQHLPEPGEVTVVLVLHLDHAPGILTCPHILVADLDQSEVSIESIDQSEADLDELVAPDHSEGQVVVVVPVGLRHRLILQGELVDGDTVRLKLVHDLPLELLQLLLVDGVRLGDDRDDVDLLVQLLHAHQVDALKRMFEYFDQSEASVKIVDQSEASVTLRP